MIQVKGKKRYAYFTKGKLYFETNRTRLEPALNNSYLAFHCPGPLYTFILKSCLGSSSLSEFYNYLQLYQLHVTHIKTMAPPDAT